VLQRLRVRQLSLLLRSDAAAQAPPPASRPKRKSGNWPTHPPRLNRRKGVQSGRRLLRRSPALCSAGLQAGCRAGVLARNSPLTSQTSSAELHRLSPCIQPPGVQMGRRNRTRAADDPMLGIAHHCIEIEHRVEVALSANPRVHRPAGPPRSTAPDDSSSAHIRRDRCP